MHLASGRPTFFCWDRVVERVFCVPSSESLVLVELAPVYAIDPHQLLVLLLLSLFMNWAVVSGILSCWDPIVQGILVVDPTVFSCSLVLRAAFSLTIDL